MAEKITSTEGLPEELQPLAINTEGVADHAAAYTPVFNDTIRTVIYVASLVASIVGLGVMCFGNPDIGGFVSTAAGVLAGGFGVAYNPVRLASK